MPMTESLYHKVIRGTYCIGTKSGKKRVMHNLRISYIGIALFDTKSFTLSSHLRNHVNWHCCLKPISDTS